MALLTSIQNQIQVLTGGLLRGIHFNLDFNSIFVQFLLLVFGVLLVSFLIDYFLSHSFFGERYRIFVAPGVILHELSHAFFCVITGARITSMSFFDKDGGSVTHEKSKLPVIGPLLISFAPLLFGLIAIFFLSRSLGLRQIDFTAIKLSTEGIMSLLKSIIAPINLSSYMNWIIAYLVLSIAVTMTPSWQDFKNVALPLIVIAAIIFAVISFGHISMNLSYLPFSRLTLLLSTVIILLILGLVLSIIAYVLTGFFKRK